MTDNHPSYDSNHVSQATKSEREIQSHQRKLNFDHRLVTITISELKTIKSLIESPDALSVADLRVWLGKRDESHGPSDYPPSWQLGQYKHLLPRKHDEQRSAPETLPVPDQPDVSPLPPIAAVYHDIPNPKCPSMNIAKQILGQRQASTYHARHMECSNIIMDALAVPLMPLLPHIETPEMAALFERLDIAQWKLSMSVLNVGHYFGISVSRGTSADL